MNTLKNGFLHWPIGKKGKNFVLQTVDNLKAACYNAEDLEREKQWSEIFV